MIAEDILLDRVLSLSVSDIKALQEGSTIASLPIAQITKGWRFFLYPYTESEPCNDVKIEVWATCEDFRLIYEAEELSTLSALTLWSVFDLERLFKERGHLSLALLRVYQLPQPIVIPKIVASGIKLGRFAGLYHFGEEFKEAIQVPEAAPILSKTVFSNRYKQISNFQISAHLDLEILQRIIATRTEHIFKEISYDLKYFLGWDDYKDRLSLIENLEWIETINELGDRSKEIEGKPKSNWQAGTDFENIVKQSLEFLGFGIDETHRGGSGGLDFFCSTPYPLTGECKCGKKIPSGTTEELIKLGGMRLPSADDFLASAKIIIGPGHPNPDVITAARKWRVSIIKPMTLQKLAEIHNRFPIDLIELKKYLNPGQMDDEIDVYIELHLAKIAIRSHVIKTFKEYLNKTKSSESGVEKFSGFFCNSNAPQHLEDRELHDILIELSSPLTGYLGRIKGGTWKADRFYFLRDLMV